MRFVATKFEYSRRYFSFPSTLKKPTIVSSSTALPSCGGHFNTHPVNKMAFTPQPPPPHSNLSLIKISRSHSTTQPRQIILLPVSHRHPNLPEIQSTITELRPDTVLLELCTHRRGMLYTPQNLPGSEFSTACAAAKSIDARVILGDLPITRTLSRAAGVLSPKDWLALLTGFVVSLFVPVPDPKLLRAVVTAQPGETVERYVTLMKESFPGLENVLVRDRDMYLAWCLRHSQAVKGRDTVLAIVGAAHIPGIVRFLNEDDHLRTSGEKPRLTFRNVTR